MPKIIVCDTVEKQVKGVIGQKRFPENTVYLFTNIRSGNMFHMASVPFALDIAFLDEQDNILMVVTMPPQYGLAKAPLKTAKAVEAPVGFFENYSKSLPLKELEND
jgi:uncharacterized membrane protein (UPF0127 family)